MSAAEPSLSKLRQLKTTLQEKTDILQQLDKEILDLMTEEDDFAEEIELPDEYREKLQLTLIDLETALASEGTQTLTIGWCLEEPHVGSRTSPPSLLESHSEARAPKVNLPKLIFKNFNGELTTWTTFWDSFESVVHNNPDLTSIDKFNYLHSLLEQTAAEAVSGLTLTAANYEEAISILKEKIRK